MNAPRPSMRRRAGFTLLEVILVLVLAGFILLSVNYFIFNMGELWGRGSETRYFHQHARGVTRFLETTIQQAALPASPHKTSGVGWYLPPAVEAGLDAEPRIGFEMEAPVPSVPWPGRALPRTVYYLGLLEEGLFLYWHSRLEDGFETQPPRSTLVSPFLREVHFEYYDAERDVWTTEETFRRDPEGDPELPQRLHLHFRHGDRVHQTVILLPRLFEGVMVF